VQLFKRLSGVASFIVNIDWSEDWPGPLPVHVWVHDFAKLYAEAGLKCASFPLPEKVDGKQQKLFIASHDLSDEVKRLERSLMFATEPGCSAAVCDDSTEQLRLATEELLQLIPAGSQFILVDDGQWGTSARWVGIGCCRSSKKTGCIGGRRRTTRRRGANWNA